MKISRLVSLKATTGTHTIWRALLKFLSHICIYTLKRIQIPKELTGVCGLSIRAGYIYICLVQVARCGAPTGVQDTDNTWWCLIHDLMAVVVAPDT